jgi:hypothetical protein
VKRLSAEYVGVAARLVYQAVNEAYALVSLTPEPLLLLPALAEEKVQKAAAWSCHRQRAPCAGRATFSRPDLPPRRCEGK